MFKINKPFIVVDGIEVFLEDLTEYHKSKLDGYLDLDLIQDFLVEDLFKTNNFADLEKICVNTDNILDSKEMANWALYFALSIFENSIDDYYQRMKLGNLDSLPDNLIILNNCFRFKKDTDRLSRLINLINKYVKRLKKIFPNSAAQKSKNFKKSIKSCH